MKTGELMQQLKDNGWALSHYADSTITYAKSFTTQLYGVLSFSVQIFVSDYKNGYENATFQRCKLYGPILKVSTFACIPHAVLGEWCTLRGALDGVLKKYSSALKEFTARSSKVHAKCR